MTEIPDRYILVALDVREELTNHVSALFEALADPAPLSISAVRMGAGEPWRLEALFAAPPDDALLAEIVRQAGAAAPPRIETLADEDWVARSNAAMPALRTDRFFIRGPHIPQTDDIGARHALEIEAGLAFGTGHHATTIGCLKALEHLTKSRAPRRILDLGTGTGLLALAAGDLWPAARLTATDIDPVATQVARANARLNSRRRLNTITCAGFCAPTLAREGPYDLIVANILAAPLIAVARDFAAHLAPGGTGILAGLLTTQAQRVLSAYRAQGLRLVRRADEGEWAILTLERPALDLTSIMPAQKAKHHVSIL